MRWWTYFAWLSNHLTLYMNDINSLCSSVRVNGLKFVVLSRDADGMTFHSVIDRALFLSQKIFESVAQQKFVTSSPQLHFFSIRTDNTSHWK